MAEFEAITTQEQLDQVISARLKRERESVKREYDGYLSPEDEKKKYEGYLSPEAEKKKYKGYLSPEQAAEMDQKIKGYETDSVKKRIAHETGIPYELAGRLSGDSEDAIRKDAEALSKIIGKTGHKAPPLRSTEPGDGDLRDAAYKQMLNNLKGE